MRKSMKKRQYQIIADAISKKIISGEFEVGSRLPAERDLCEDFGVSRPVIREAVIALETTGCISVKHGSGAWVVGLPGNRNIDSVSISTAPSPFEAMQARIAIESESAALAARLGTEEDFEQIAQCLSAMQSTNSSKKHDDFKQADLEFHLAIAKASKNSIFEQLVNDLWSLRYSGAVSEFVFERVEASGWKPTHKERHDIFLAIKNRDEFAAREAMVSHLNRVVDAMLQATEVKEMERVKQSLDSQRFRFSKGMPAQGAAAKA